MRSRRASRIKSPPDRHTARRKETRAPRVWRGNDACGAPVRPRGSGCDTARRSELCTRSACPGLAGDHLRQPGQPEAPEHRRLPRRPNRRQGGAEIPEPHPTKPPRSSTRRPREPATSAPSSVECVASSGHTVCTVFRVRLFAGATVVEQLFFFGAVVKGSSISRTALRPTSRPRPRTAGPWQCPTTWPPAT